MIQYPFIFVLCIIPWIKTKKLGGILHMIMCHSFSTTRIFLLC